MDVRATSIAVLALVTLAACSRGPRELVVLHAASLTRPFGDIAEAYQRENPSVGVRLEPSGSQIAARKVSEQHMAADLVAVADAKIIENILVPSHATYALVFATNEIVLAHKDHSRFTDEVRADNWPQILRRPGIRLGRVDPDTAPLGYHTLFAWQLAERSAAYGEGGKNLAEELVQRCPPASVVHDETELLSQLETRTLDYAFLYRSTAEDHHLKITELPPDENLSRPELAGRYAAASVEVRMKQGEARTRILGAPITYGLAIPKGAPHEAEAIRFVSFLLGDKGTRILGRRGLRPVQPARCSPCVGLPEDLGPLVAPGR